MANNKSFEQKIKDMAMISARIKADTMLDGKGLAGGLAPHAVAQTLVYMQTGYTNGTEPFHVDTTAERFKHFEKVYYKSIIGGNL